jgi:rhamnose transport system permease protein
VRSAKVRRILAVRELGIVLLLVLVFVAATLKDSRFLQPGNIESILLWVPLLVVVGIGQMLVIVTRGIDVSVGSMVGVSAMAAGLCFRSNGSMPITVGLLIALGVGTLLGSVNGALIAFGKVPPIIATLGTLGAYRGACFIISHSQQVDTNFIPDALIGWSQEGPMQAGGVLVPWILVVVLAISCLASWFVKRTRIGRDVFSLGSNPEGARLRGVHVSRTIFLVYAITGALSGLAGFLYLSRFGFANPATAGQGLELVVIAAVVIGGTNIMGGSGTVLGVVLGCLLLGAINVALSVLGIDATWQQLVYGSVILLAVIVDTGLQRAIAGGAT